MLLLTMSLMFADCGNTTQTDENIVLVYNGNTDDWTALLVKEFQEQVGMQVRLVSGVWESL